MNDVALNLMVAIPELLLAGLLCLLLVACVYLNEHRRYRLAHLATLGSLILTLVALILIPNQDQVALGGLFASDTFIILFKILVLAAAFFSLLIGDSFIQRNGFDRFEYPILAGFSVLGMLMMLSANNLMALYIGLELQSLSLYVLATMRRDSLSASEAGLKYFVLGALASGLLLYGSSLIYGFVGSTDFVAIANALQAFTTSDGMASYGTMIGLVFVVVALGFKLSAAPFHMWAPDVYEGVPTSVTAFFTAAPKIAAMGLTVRLVFEPFGDLVDQWQQIIVALSAFSMLLGGFAGLVQKNIKRLMAYSSIGHVGFALMGLAAGTQSGATSVTVYLTIYLFTVIGSFSCIIAMRRQDQPVEAIDDLAGFGKTHPVSAIILMLFMFSMAGIPPLAGFFAKWYVFMAAIENGLAILAVIGALSSVIAAFYYLRIIKVMYFDEAEQPLDQETGLAIRWTGIIAAVLVVGFVFYPTLITLPAKFATTSLF